MEHHKLVHIAIQVLSAESMINALVNSFEHRPERLDAIDMRHLVDVLADRMPNRTITVSVQLLVRLEIVFSYCFLNPFECVEAVEWFSCSIPTIRSPLLCASLDTGTPNRQLQSAQT